MLYKNREIDVLKRLIESDYTSCILNDYGNTGICNLKMILEIIPSIFKFIKLQDLNSIIIFKSDNFILSEHSDNYFTIENFSHFGSIDSNCVTLQINNLNEIIVTTSDISISDIIKTDFAYQYTPQKEFFHTKTKIFELPKIPGADSCFALSTFKSLDEAILHYKTCVVRKADCQSIKMALQSEKRIFFNPHPEHLLRDSMVYFLKARLRGENLEIRPEQTIDTTHPVDIKVTWGETNHIALIEIKWLGKSLNNKTKTVTSNYADSRARDGAKQLAEYLDANIVQVPNHTTIGYLIVFDLRRKSTTPNSTNISVEDGYWFQNKEIEYNPKYHVIRKDFVQPVRMFIEPLCI